jgi:hypothetical protein
VGWALLIGNLVFQAAKSMMSGLGFEGEDPRQLFARTFVFSFLLLASPQICQLCLDMTSTVIGIMELPNAVGITLAAEDAFDGLSCAWLLVIICGVIVMFQSFKLIFEMAERYVILAVLTICAPLAFGTGGSKNTANIFNGWCRMYGSMCLLMVLNVVFVKMLLSALAFVPSGLDVLLWMVLVISIVKVAKKADDIITRIGLNPAMTGNSLGRTFPGMLTYVVTRTATAQVAKAIGKSGGKNRGNGGFGGAMPGNTSSGHSGSTTSHTGKWSGTASGHGGTTASGSATGNTYHQQKNGGQTAAQQNTTQQSTTAQGAAQAGGFQKNATQFSGQQKGATPKGVKNSFADSTQVTQTSTIGNQGRQTRKTSVPPGTHRSFAHTKIAAATTTVSNRGTAPQTTAPAGTPPSSTNFVPPGAVQRGTAGKSGTASPGATETSRSTRFSNVTAQTTSKEAANHHATANESSILNVGIPHSTTPPNASVQVQGKSGGISQQDGRTETRFTQRQPGSAPQEHRQTLQTAAPTTNVTASVIHHGGAGTTPTAQHPPQAVQTVQAQPKQVRSTRKTSAVPSTRKGGRTHG